MASGTTKWRSTGVFFDNVAVRFADGAAAVRRTAVLDDPGLEGVLPATAYSGPEEFTYTAPIPGRASDGAYDGRPDVIVVYRLSLDVYDHLN